MTEEEKELLLKDLSARLPYNVYVYFKTRYRCNAITDVLNGVIYTYIETHLLEDDDENEIDIIKPYLRPMSSMTEEEKEEFSVLAVGTHLFKGPLIPSYDTLDWLNAHHFDYRELIEKGLALKTPDGMYNIN